MVDALLEGIAGGRKRLGGPGDGLMYPGLSLGPGPAIPGDGGGGVVATGSGAPVRPSPPPPASAMEQLREGARQAELERRRLEEQSAAVEARVQELLRTPDEVAPSFDETRAVDPKRLTMAALLAMGARLAGGSHEGVMAGFSNFIGGQRNRAKAKFDEEVMTPFQRRQSQRAADLRSADYESRGFGTKVSAAQKRELEAKKAADAAAKQEMQQQGRIELERLRQEGKSPIEQINQLTAYLVSQGAPEEEARTQAYNTVYSTELKEQAATERIKRLLPLEEGQRRATIDGLKARYGLTRAQAEYTRAMTTWLPTLRAQQVAESQARAFRAMQGSLDSPADKLLFDAGLQQINTTIEDHQKTVDGLMSDIRDLETDIAQSLIPSKRAALTAQVEKLNRQLAAAQKLVKDGQTAREAFVQKRAEALKSGGVGGDASALWGQSPMAPDVSGIGGGLPVDGVGSAFGVEVPVAWAIPKEAQSVLGKGRDDVKAMVVKIAVEEGLDPRLALAVAMQESRFNQGSVSPKGALGVMQLMPGTARGLKVDPKSLDGNIRGGVRYLMQQLQKFGGDVEKALGAYNAGPGAVTSGRYLKIAETRDYITKVGGYYGALAGQPVATSTTQPGVKPAPGKPGGKPPAKPGGSKVVQKRDGEGTYFEIK